MGEVYRARDLKLDRDVAIKILRQPWLADPERRARFDREARLLASVNHANVAAIYGIDDSSGRQLIVLELVEGSTLAERIGKGPLPLAEALRAARQIADALSAAHERGIVHRDLKPANVKITATGVVKVLDFGIAKVAGSFDGDGSATPTLTAMTAAGVVIGTAPYMSPEQARGLPVDRRTDVWAFGCVLYEMLAGCAAFTGATSSDVFAAILDREPDWARLPASTPAPIRRLLRQCLRKDQSERLRDIADIRARLDDAIDEPAPPPSARATRSPRAWQAVAAAAVFVAAFLGWLQWKHPSAPAETVRLSVWSPGSVTPQLSGAISPDGRQLAFVATGPSRKAMLWIRSLDSLQSREIPGTERAAHPFWAPDGRSIGFLANAKLNVLDLASGRVQVLADAPVRSGAAWNRDGIILFMARSGELSAVPASGGTVTPIVTSERGQVVFGWPDFLPDGRHFLYVAQSSPDVTGVYVGSLDSKESKLVMRTDIQAKYGAPGYLLFMHDDTLMAQPFDVARLELSGTPSPVADGVWFARGASHASFSAATTGAIAYVNASAWDSQLDWVDRDGRPLGSVGGRDRYSWFTPQLSPDATKIAIDRGEFGRGDIWILDPSRGTPSRVTFSPKDDGLPLWSADGRRLMIQSGTRVTLKDLATGGDEVLFEASEGERVADWSRDGRFVVLSRDRDIWVHPLAGGRQPFAFQETPVNETQMQLSPDGKWIAYTSNETGRDEVYVQSFPKPGRKRQVSPDGGAMPRWRRDGGELFYLAANQFMMSAPAAIRGGALALDTPVPLFHTTLVVQGSEASGLPTSYDVTSDGRRFLLCAPPHDAGPPMTIVLNWPGALRK